MKSLALLWILLTVAVPPAVDAQTATTTNLVQNGTFRGLFDYWHGNIPAIAFNPHAPNGVYAAVTDAYQVIPTTPGQSYLLSFSAAADLLFGPSVSIGVDLDGRQAMEITTPPYTYNNQSNRSDQLHWQPYTTAFVASGTSTRLEFIDLNTPYFALADVSVIADGAPPLVTLSGPLNLSSPTGIALGIVNAEVQSPTAVTLVWTVDGIACQTNFVARTGAPIHTNVTLTASFTTGAHIVTVSASGGQSSPFLCSTTVTVYSCTLPDLIVNGSFENGFQGWSGSIGLVPTPNTVSGTKVAALVDGTTQCHQIIITAPGTTYRINFGIRLPELHAGGTTPIIGPSGGLPTVVQLRWNNHTIESIPVTSRDWTFYTFDVQSTQVTNTITFYNQDPSKAWPFLDNVSVVPVVQPSAMISPEPLSLECTNGSSVATISVVPPAICGNPLETMVWSVDGIPHQTNYVPTPNPVSFMADVGLGQHLLTASVTTGTTNVGQSSTTVTVNDTTPPVITIAGPNPLTNECHAIFSDPGAMAIDSCAGTLPSLVTNTVNPDLPGAYSISYTATDPSGNSTTISRKVYIIDSTPPQISTLAATPSVLWPPNHMMIPVHVNIIASDNCDASPNARIAKVISNQSPASSVPDWKITGPLSVELRAERSGSGGDRIYTLVIEVSDSNGNKTATTLPITVPHSQR